MEIALKDIRIDGGTQPRAAIDEDVVAEYAIKMEEGAEFPPVIVFFDGVDTWLADGFHRFHAATKAHRKHIEATTRRGTKRDAILYSVGANVAHGLRRTNEDKRRAIQTLLNDPEWTQWSSREIARLCAVHSSTVDDLRKASAGFRQIESPRKVERGGAVYMQRTENIGKRLNTRGREIVLPEGRKHADVRAEEIRALADGGHVASQIAQALGIGETQVRLISKKFGVRLPDHALGKRARFDSRKAIESAVMELDSAAASLRVLPISLEGITAVEALEWAESLAASIKQFRAFERKLREHHGN